MINLLIISGVIIIILKYGISRIVDPKLRINLLTPLLNSDILNAIISLFMNEI